MASTSGADRIGRLAAVAVVAVLAGCSSDSKKPDASDVVDSGSTPDADLTPPPAEAGNPAPATGVTPPTDGKPWPTLAEWNLFKDPVKQEPQDRVVPYEVIARLFTDYAVKRRFIYVPEGEHIQYADTGYWDFPVGSILVKTFSYLTDARDPSKGERLLETRLLFHEPDGWTPHTYIWNVEQTATHLEKAGDVLQTEFIDPSGASRTNAYVVPSNSNCRECHGKLGLTDTIGGKTLQLDRDNDYGSGPENQIDHLADLGFFASPPTPRADRDHLVDPFDTSEPLAERARSYIDGNCSHCHNPDNGPGSLSGFWLDYASTAPDQPTFQYGICKRPASAGHGTCGRPLDIVPGHPEDSIMSCRMGSTLSDTAMPPLGRQLVHTEGVALIDEWITSLSGDCPGTGGADAGATLPDAGGSSDVEAGSPADASSDVSTPPADATTDVGAG